MRYQFRMLAGFALIILFAACGGGGGGSTGDVNSVPVADAGTDAAAYRQETVVLDGGGSADPDGDDLFYHWEFVSLPSSSSLSSLADSSTLSASFVPDVLGTFRVRLTVDDGELTAEDEVTVSVLNRPPVASAGEDASQYLEDGAVALSGDGCSDPDGDSLSYQWSFDTLPSSSALSSLAASTSMAASFQPDAAGNYTVRLSVNDGHDWASDTVVINVTGPAPVPAADAGQDRDVLPGSGTVTLDGSQSADPDGLTLVSYTWTQEFGPDVTGGVGTLSGATPGFAAPAEPVYLTFSLVVSNGYNESQADRVMVRVVPDPGYGFVFVDPASGDDANPGTASEPVATLTRAMALAESAVGADVYLGWGTYIEQLIVPDATRVMGGFNPATWERDFLSPTIVASSAETGASLVGLSNGALLDGLDIRSMNGAGPGRSSYGVVIASSAGVTVRNCTVQAGDGAAGSDGRPAMAGQPGQPGASVPFGSTGIAPGGAGIYSGGNGGGGTYGRGNDGSAGQPGAPDGGTGGLGGDVISQGGTNGGVGVDGLDGGPGFGGPSFGSAAGATYNSSSASGIPGRQGTPGSGGGGGGAGGAVQIYTSPSTFRWYPGGGGGGGGAGGAGGQGGNPGSGGGGSFGIFALNSSAVVVSNCAVRAGAGGAGGDGAPGAPGGFGGPGGTGNVGPYYSGRGGNGGNGGAGGSGGQGGGGGGGPSIGIFRNSGVSLLIKGTAIVPGRGGDGGSASIPVAAGARGLTTQVYTR